MLVGAAAFHGSFWNVSQLGDERWALNRRQDLTEYVSGGRMQFDQTKFARVYFLGIQLPSKVCLQ